MHPENRALLDAKVRRIVGVAALRRLRHLVDESVEEDRYRAVFAKRVFIGACAGAVLLTLLCLMAPQTVVASLRSVVGLIR